MKHILDRVGRAKGDRVDRAFTLLEILIAVAALGVIAVGVAAIFAATGKTVTTGKRVSAFNAYASLIEQRFRADINAMVRDKGFLVIRNELATDPTSTAPVAINVPLYDGDEGARQRRIDEILFFAKGDFQTARAAMDSASIARSDTARIYIGHGQRRPAPTPPPSPFNPALLYYTPQVNDDNQRLEFPGGSRNYLLGAPNPDSPNQFASDWTLLRHVTLLCPPSTAIISPPAGVNQYLPSAARCQDGPSQVALQPAAFSIFRSLAYKFPNANYPTGGVPGTVRDSALLPNFPAGIVDIATTDLSVINAIYTTANVYPSAVGDKFFDSVSNQNSANEQSNVGVDNILRLYVPGTGDSRALNRIQSWMNDAFPAFSMSDDPATRARMRYEPTPTNFVGAVSYAWPENDYETAYRTTDQVMLSASNFLPRCTEFIVEWSFGKTIPNIPAGPNSGQLVWHGMERRVGANLVAYPYISSASIDRVVTPFQRVDGTAGPGELVTSELIHGFPNLPPNLPAPITSYFGSVNPTFNPDKDPAGGDGVLDRPLDSASPTIPWAWPKLIRVTLSLADPSDPSIERTFQFVFQVPEPDGV